MNRIKRLAYVVYILLVLFFFLYYLFPSEKVSRYIASNLNFGNSDIKITIADIKPVFPFSLKFKAASLFYKNQKILSIAELKLTPGLFTLFGPEASFFFQGKAQGGVLKGKVDISRNSLPRRLKVDVNLFQIRIKGNTGLADRLHLDIFGIVSGNVVFRKNQSQLENISAEMDIANCRIDLRLANSITKAFEFNHIKTDFLTYRKKIAIKECSFTGPQAEGSVTGSIDWSYPVGKSKIDLNGNLTPHDPFLKQTAQIFYANTGSEKNPKDNRYSLHLSGTVDQPIVNVFDQPF